MTASLAPAGKRSQAYYEYEDIYNYYTNPDEQRGWWTGGGARHFGLHGPVDPYVFDRLFRGFSPDNRVGLVQNAGSPRRRPGLDLGLSSPKGVSIVKYLGSPETRRLVGTCEFHAANRTIQYLEDNATFGRVGKDGVDRVNGQLVVSCFPHAVSRLGDPQSHIHGFLHSIVLLPGGKTVSLNSKPLYYHKMTAGQVFRTELAYELQSRLGFEIEKGKLGTFDVKGVPRILVTAWSRRRADIERVLNAKGLSSAAAAAVATLETRPAKIRFERDALLSQWQATGQAHGFSEVDVERLRSRHVVEINRIDTEAILEAAVSRLQNQVSFREQDVIRAIAAEALGLGVNVTAVEKMTRQLLSSPDIERLHNGRYCFTGMSAQKLEIDEPLYQGSIELEQDEYEF